VSLTYEECLFRRFDPEKLLHALRHTHMEHRLLGGGAYNVRLQYMGLAGLTITAGDYSFPVSARGCIPHDQVFLGLNIHTTGELRENYQEVSLNKLVLYAPGMELQYTSLGTNKWIMLMLPLERLQEAAIARQGVELTWPRQGLRQIDLHPLVVDRLRRELQGLLQFGKHFGGVPDTMLIESLASEGLVQLLVQAITHGCSSSVPNLSAGRNRALNALEISIESWINDPDRGLRVADIEGTSQRMMEIASREIYGVTPHRWIKMAQLNAAYRDLLDLHCSSVTEVCEKWGIGHTGRFAKDYRALFGESPRDTLKNSGEA
jgi:AraC family ethanolamine operon transcriptional activator